MSLVYLPVPLLLSLDDQHGLVVYIPNFMVVLFIELCPLLLLFSLEMKVVNC